MKISVVTPSIRPLGLDIVRNGLLNQTFKGFEWLVEIGLGKHDLNAAYNRMLTRARGELVVSLQDFILIKPDYLEKWWKAYQQRPKAFLTAPVGKMDNLAYSGNAVWDWRAWTDGKVEDFRPCNWDCWEIDSGAAPLKALKEIGGFDEELDGHWSADNLNVACRAQLAGYEFYNLFTNPSVAYDHDAFITHPFRTDIDSTNAKRMVMFRGGMTLPALH